MRGESITTERVNEVAVGTTTDTALVVMIYTATGTSGATLLVMIGTTTGITTGTALVVNVHHSAVKS